MVSPSAGDVGRLVIANDYQWIGNPRAAGFAVYVDGRRVGVAPIGKRLSVQVEPGLHLLRVRLWYFLSPRVTVDVKPGETARFSANIPTTLPLWRKVRGLVDPFHWLTLKEGGLSGNCVVFSVITLGQL
jgi:PEGA domain